MTGSDRAIVAVLGFIAYTVAVVGLSVLVYHTFGLVFSPVQTAWVLSALVSAWMLNRIVGRGPGETGGG